MFLFHTYPPMKMEQTECSETSAHKIQTPGKYPEESHTAFFSLDYSRYYTNGGHAAGDAVG